MLQRIQTVYLAVAVILLVFCCSMPLAEFEPQGMGLMSVMYSLAYVSADGEMTSHLPVALLVLDILAELVIIMAILGYKNRRSQMKLCSLGSAVLVLWTVAYLLLAVHFRGEGSFHPCVAAFFPVTSLVLTVLARRAIKRDDDLVRSADRIR